MWNTIFVNSVEFQLITQSLSGFSRGAVTRLVKKARFADQMKNTLIFTQVLCVQYLLFVLFFVAKELGNFCMICFRRPAPSLKSAQMQWAFECGKPSNSPCCSMTVICDTGSITPASWPFVIPDCSVSV